ncbi:phosphate acetyltransferase [Rapidithrix thailandica]|uniref:Phosphate acetyltransferase n=1 Tax=Rapidithrix thailandica TaxID=413964 RepID=A0AAW9RVX6_9BACT
MAYSIYLTTTESHCGKSLVSLGIMDLLLRKSKKVGIFRPIITQRFGDAKDRNIELLRTHFQLEQGYEESFAYYRNEARDLMQQGRSDEMLERIIQKYKALEKKLDIIVVEGSDFEEEAASFEFNINAEIARNLGCPVIILSKGLHRDTSDILSSVQLAVDVFLEKECQVLGTIINKAQPEAVEELRQALEEKISYKQQFFSVIPSHPVLQSPTVKEIADHLGAKVLFGQERLHRQVHRYSIAAMQMPNYLEYVDEKCLTITPGDRGDIILSVLQAHNSINYPQISGILLTTGLQPAPTVMRLLEGVPDIIPIISVDTNTYQTATDLEKVTTFITPENETKIDLSLRLFEEYVNTDAVNEQVKNIRQRGMTPKMFTYNLFDKARALKKRIVLPEGNDERILKAASILMDREIVDLTVLGERDEILETTHRLGINLDVNKVTITSPKESPHFERYVETFYELRKDKGVTMDIARDVMCDVSYFATMMVYCEDADGMVSGAAHTTQHTIRPALQFVKTKPGSHTVSSVFFMCLDDRVLVYGDCAINPNPNAEQLAEIAISSAETSLAFGIEPKVALLSYSSGDSGKGADVEKVREATRLAKARRPDLKIEGPIQYDAAVDKEVGKKKMPGSEVAGQATVLIFPDLNTGNNTYKAVQRETGAIAIGPVLQGLNKPVNDLSRGCTVEDIVNTVAITAIQTAIG